MKEDKFGPCAGISTNPLNKGLNETDHIKNVIDQISEIQEKFDKINSERKVLVVHPTVMEALKDHITISYPDHNITAYMFDGKVQMYLSFKLPKDHFCMVTMQEYEEHLKA